MNAPKAGSALPWNPEAPMVLRPWPDALGWSPVAVESRLLTFANSLSPVNARSVAVKKQRAALSIVLLKPEDAAVRGKHVDAS